MRYTNKLDRLTPYRKPRLRTAAWLKPALLGGAALVILFLEKKIPLRSQVESKPRHDFRNVAVSGLSALTIKLTEKPLTDRLTALVAKNRIGLLPRLGLPKWAETAAAIILLDYTLYLWHILTHKWSFLWRFHEVHHEDLDLTASTALRFHFAEMGLSAFWRSAQVVLIGVSSKALSAWQTLTLCEILFHHSNIKLPERFERFLSRIIVTPRIHSIHHSTVREETNSNWSSGLTIWDYLHDTIKLDVPQASIEIGVPGYGTDEDVKFASLLKKPFKKQRESWAPRHPARSERSHTLGHSTLSYEDSPGNY